MSPTRLLSAIKTGYEKYQSFVKKFIYSDFYLAFVAIVALLGWYSENAAFGITASVIIAGLALLAADDVLPFTINFFSAVLLVYSYDFADYSYLWPLAFPLGACLIVFMVKNGRHKFSLGKMFFPLVAIAYAMLIGGAGVMIKQDFLRVLPDFVLLGLGVPTVYLFTNHYLKKDDRRDVPNYFAKSMMYIGLVVCLQLIISIANTISELHTPLCEWYNMSWVTGWGNRNSIATYLIFTACMTLYLSTRYRQGWIYIAIAAFQYVCLVLTFSRGGIIFGALSALFAFAFTIIKAPSKGFHMLYLAIVMLGILIMYLIFRKEVNTMVGALLDRGMDSSGRLDLYKEAWELFKAHPFLGVGRGYVGSRIPANSIGVYWFHSTIMQVAACMGLVGLAAYAYFYGMRLYILFKNIRNSFNLFCLAIFIGFEGYSLINTGTMVAYPSMMLVIVITALLENVQKDYSGYVTPYNFSTPWGERIVQKEHEIAEKIRARNRRRRIKKLPDNTNSATR